MTDAVTRSWCRNVSDERAAAAGCRFDEERGSFVVWWVEHFCRLYEGEWAGQAAVLHGCHRCGTYGLPPATSFGRWEDARPTYLERARRYAACFAAGHPVDWQYECTLRLFGWVRHSEKWKREVRRFRQASIWVAKKNKKSPTLAAWCLYLTVGDGEDGQKVFLGAKDGMQARKIAGEHAVAMVEQSPDLSRTCRVNRSTMRISHRDSRSYMEPLSSSNARTQESKEGINGSVMVDEVHVVDRDFIRRVSRAGISRSEPLQIEVSTAGNNPDGYGRERFDLALEILDGRRTDQDLFAAVYAAPQELTEADLEADPARWGRMANPAWGHTVDPEEFLKDFEQSKRTIQGLLDFKMYRLNIWQKGSNPWLRAGDWQRCHRHFTEADLLGRECYAALDLARTRDMTALALCFPLPEEGEETYALLPYFWLPRDRALELESKCDVFLWARDGHLTLTPGGVTDYGYVRAKFKELAEKFDVRELAYDPKFGEETTQALSDGITAPDGKMLEEGTGVERVVFAQNDENFAAPTQDFERLVIAGKLRHNGHPVLAWQAGHAQVMVKISKVKRVVKPTKEDYRTVDGVAAGIMALARATQAKPVEYSVEVF